MTIYREWFEKLGISLNPTLNYTDFKEEDLSISRTSILNEEKEKIHNPMSHYGVEFHYITSKEEAQKIFQILLKTKEILSLDIETYPHEGGNGLDPFTSEIRLIQIYAGENVIYVFDIHKIAIGDFPPDLWTKPIVCHNALFELKHLLHRNCPLKSVGCTMLMAFVIKGQAIKIGFSLKKLVDEFLDIDLSKEEQLSDWSKEILEEAQIRYAACDAFVTYKLFRKLREEIRKRGLSKAYEVRRDAQLAVSRMMLKGLFFNRDKHKILIDNWKREEELYKNNTISYLGSDINPNSSKQLGEWIENNLPKEILRSWPRTDKGVLCTQNKIISRYRHHIIWGEDYKIYKKYTKKLSTYGESLKLFIHPKTGRIHPEILLTGTDTGRMSSRNPNSQNFPRNKDFRELFEAHKGKVLVVADYSQIELRVAAIVTQDRVMKEAYEKGLDLHTKTAAAITGIKEEYITKEQRQLAKAVNFGFLYGQEANGFVNYAKDTYGISITIQEASAAKEKFLDTYQDLKTWQIKTRYQAKRTLKVSTPLGYVRHFDSAKKTYNQSLNTPIQGGAAEVMLRALYFLNLALDWKRASLINCIHDELILECNKDYIEEGSQVLKDSMIRGFLDVFPNETTNNLVEINHGLNWQEAK